MVSRVSSAQSVAVATAQSEDKAPSGSGDAKADAKADAGAEAKSESKSSDAQAASSADAKANDRGDAKADTPSASRSTAGSGRGERGASTSEAGRDSASAGSDAPDEGRRSGRGKGRTDSASRSDSADRSDRGDSGTRAVLPSARDRSTDGSTRAGPSRSAVSDPPEARDGRSARDPRDPRDARDARTARTRAAADASGDARALLAQRQADLTEAERQYGTRAAGKNGLQRWLDDRRVDLAWTTDAHGNRYRDDQFKNLGVTRQAYQRIAQQLDRGELTETQARAQIERIHTGFAYEAGRVDQAQQDNAAWGRGLHSGGRVVTMTAAGLGATALSGGNLFVGIAAGTAAGGLYDAATVAAARNDGGPRSSIAPTLEVNNSWGGVGARLLAGEQVTEAQWRQAHVGQLNDVVSATSVVGGFKLATAAKASLPAGASIGQQALALTGASTKTTLATTAAQLTVRSGDTLTDGRLTEAQKLDKLGTDARSTALRLPADLVFGAIGSYGSARLQLANPLLDVAAQYGLDSSTALANTALNNTLEGKAALSTEELAATLTQSTGGTLQDLMVRPDQRTNPTTQMRSEGAGATTGDAPTGAPRDAQIDVPVDVATATGASRTDTPRPSVVDQVMAQFWGGDGSPSADKLLNIVNDPSPFEPATTFASMSGDEPPAPIQRSDDLASMPDMQGLPSIARRSDRLTERMEQALVDYRSEQPPPLARAEALRKDAGRLLSDVEYRLAVLDWQTGGVREREVKRIEKLQERIDTLQTQAPDRLTPRQQRTLDALVAQQGEATGRLADLDRYVGDRRTALQARREQVLSAWRPLAEQTGLPQPRVRDVSQGPLGAGKHLSQTIDFVAKHGTRAALGLGSGTAVLTSGIFGWNMMPEVRNSPLQPGTAEIELARLRGDPNYVAENYGWGAHNASGDLWKIDKPGSGSEYFRRIPHDIWKELKAADERAGRVPPSGDVIRMEPINGQDTPVRLLPPYRESSKVAIFHQTEDPLSPFNRVATWRFQIGPTEGWQSNLRLTSLVGYQERAPEHIFKIQFDPIMRVPYYSVRAQQASYNTVASVGFSPAEIDVSRLTNLTRAPQATWDSRSPVTNLSLLSTATYNVTGARQRWEVLLYPRGEVLTPQLEAGGVAGRFFGFNETGVMTYFVNAGGKHADGSTWNAGVRAYFEHLIHPSNFRFGPPQGGGQHTFTWNYSGGPDPALELYTRNVLPLPFKGVLPWGLAATTATVVGYGAIDRSRRQEQIDAGRQTIDNNAGQSAAIGASPNEASQSQSPSQAAPDDRPRTLFPAMPRVSGALDLTALPEALRPTPPTLEQSLARLNAAMSGMSAAQRTQFAAQWGQQPTLDVAGSARLAQQIAADTAITTRAQLDARSASDKALTPDQQQALPAIVTALKSVGAVGAEATDAQVQAQLQGGITIQADVARLEQALDHFEQAAAAQGLSLNDRSYPPFVLRVRPDGQGDVTFFSGKLEGVREVQRDGRTAPTIGLYGGVGPRAGVDFAKNIVALWPQVAAERGMDSQRPFDVLLLSNSATPDRSARIADPANPDPQPALDGGLRTLVSLGADTTCVACNTAHHWLGREAIDNALGHHAWRQLSIVDALADDLQRRDAGPVIVLATQGTTDAGIYQNVLRERGIDVVDLHPDEVAAVHRSIYDYIKAANPDGGREILLEIAAQHPDSVLALCCTELGLVLNARDTPDLVDAGRLIDNNVVSPLAVINKHLDDRIEGEPTLRQTREDDDDEPPAATSVPAPRPQGPGDGTPGEDTSVTEPHEPDELNQSSELNELNELSELNELNEPTEPNEPNEPNEPPTDTTTSATDERTTEAGTTEPSSIDARTLADRTTEADADEQTPSTQRAPDNAASERLVLTEPPQIGGLQPSAGTVAYPRSSGLPLLDQGAIADAKCAPYAVAMVLAQRGAAADPEALVRESGADNRMGLSLERTAALLRDHGVAEAHTEDSVYIERIADLTTRNPVIVSLNLPQEHGGRHAVIVDEIVDATVEGRNTRVAGIRDPSGGREYYVPVTELFNYMTGDAIVLENDPRFTDFDPSAYFRRDTADAQPQQDSTPAAEIDQQAPGGGGDAALGDDVQQRAANPVVDEVMRHFWSDDQATANVESDGSYFVMSDRGDPVGEARSLSPRERRTHLFDNAERIASLAPENAPAYVHALADSTQRLIDSLRVGDASAGDRLQPLLGNVVDAKALLAATTPDNRREAETLARAAVYLDLLSVTAGNEYMHQPTRVGSDASFVDRGVDQLLGDIGDRLAEPRLSSESRNWYESVAALLAGGDTGAEPAAPSSYQEMKRLLDRPLPADMQQALERRWQAIDERLARIHSRIDMSNTSDPRVQRINAALINERIQLSSSVHPDLAGSTQQPRQEINNWLNANATVQYAAQQGTPLSADNLKILNQVIGGEGQAVVVNGQIQPYGQYRSEPISPRSYPQRQFLSPDNRGIERAMVDFERWLAQAQQQQMPPIQMAAQAYARLSSIHPFGDGSGRTSRLAMNWLLQANNYPPAALDPLHLPRMVDLNGSSVVPNVGAPEHEVTTAMERSLDLIERELGSPGDSRGRGFGRGTLSSAVPEGGSLDRSASEQAARRELQRTVDRMSEAQKIEFFDLVRKSLPDSAVESSLTRLSAQTLVTLAQRATRDDSVETRHLIATRAASDQPLTPAQDGAFEASHAALLQSRVLPATTTPEQAKALLARGVSVEMSVDELKTHIQRFIAQAGARGIELNDRAHLPFIYRLRPDGSGNATFFSGTLEEVPQPRTQASSRPTLGVYGGVGTEAGVDFVQNFATLYPQVAPTTGHDPAQRPFDVLLVSNSGTPDRSWKLKNIEEYPVPSPQGALDGGLRSLFRLGADVSVVACNTAHYWLGERAINEALGRFAPKQMSLVDMLGQSLQDRGVERVAVMATTGTTDARIYQDALAARGIEVVDFAREEVETVHSAIYDDIKAGHVDRAVDRLRAVVDAHPDVTIALCCTELGLALNPTRTPEYFDSGRLIDNNVVSPMLVLDRLLDEIPVQRPSNPPDPRAPAR